MKKLAIAALLLLTTRFAHALVVSNVSFSDTNITYEAGGIPNGTTIAFTIDTPGQILIAINCGIQNVGDTGTNVANLSQIYATSGVEQLFWNGLWLINGQTGRMDTSCQFTLTLSSSGTNSPSVTSPTLVTLNSVDIHSVSVTPTIDANGAASAPYSISYALAKAANVTMTISNSSSTVVRTLLPKVPEAGETSISTHTVVWDGLADNGQPVSLGNYTLEIAASDPAVANSQAIPRFNTITVQSLSGAAGDPQKTFESNVYVYPNPVRNGQGLFNVIPVRDNATIHLRIYTISGDLVLDKDITGQLPYSWNAVNQAGNKVGRGLYYYVVRENDAQGTLQVTKKMVVLP